MTQSNFGSSTDAVVETPLLATKLFVPRVHAETMPRPRLVAQLDKGLTVPLTLVAAPAGFGKTTVLIQWLHEKDCPVAWFSLDVRDNDAVTFLRYIVTALRTVAPNIGIPTLALLAAPQPPRTVALLTPLLNELAALEHDLVLVLDDYHVLTAPAIHEAVAFLLEHLPPQLHLVVTTREEPPLPLTRLRARRQLVELRASDLRFTTEEAATFLHTIMHIAISGPDVEALEQRTEGWIVGLHLAGLALQDGQDVSGFVRAFTGSDRFVVEYLVEEVIERLPAHVRSFVLYTSVLERFCAPLCDAVMLGDAADAHDSYSAVLIEQIERMNLFVIPLDNQRHWFRYHHLFADVIRSRVEHGALPETAARLYGRASEWCERNGSIREAIQYAIRGNAPDRAADLLEQYGEILTAQIGPGDLVRWIAQLPRVVLAARPTLSLTYGMALAWTDRFGEATSLLVAAETAIAAQPIDHPNVLTQRAAALRVVLTVMQAEPPAQVVTAGRRALDIIGGHNSPLQGAVSLALGIGYILQGDDQAALQLWSQATAACRQAGDGHMEVHIVAHMGRVLTYRGQLRQAERVLRDMAQRADEPYLRGIPTRGYTNAMLSRILYERNALDEAQQLAMEVIELCKSWSMPRILLHAYVPLAMVHQVTGDLQRAQQYMQQALDVIEHDQLKQTFISVTAYQARMWLNAGNLAAAAQWAEEVAPTIVGPLDPAFDVVHVNLARVLMAQGHLEEAAQLLDRVIVQSEVIGRRGRMIEGYVVQAHVAEAQRDSVRAATALRQALALAKPEGFVRTFVDEGAPMAELLTRLRSDSSAPHLRSYIERLLAAFPSADPANESPSAVLTHSISHEPLNERELAVLRLIGDGRSNREIADHLMVATSTVKWHINNLYGKLGVNSRTQALARATELGLR